MTSQWGGVDGRVAFGTTAAQAHCQDHELSEVAYFTKLDMEDREGAEQLRPPAADSVVDAVFALDSLEAREALGASGASVAGIALRSSS